MPRRMITPDLFRNEKVGNLNYLGRLLFIGMFSNADDDGRLKASPKYLKALIFPYDNIDFDELQQQKELMHNAGLIHCYNVNGGEYLYCIGWEEHQAIRKDRYNPSKIPAPNTLLPTDVQPDDNQLTTDVQPDDNHLSGSGCHSIVKYSIDKVNINNIYVIIFDFWNEKKIIVHQKITDGIKKSIEKALKDYTEEDIKIAINNYAEILHSDEYWWNYKWSLSEFLTRNNCDNIDRFKDIETVRTNYKIKGNGKNEADSGTIKHHADVKIRR